MIRGRHRGLPVAIDRAIVLPNEYNKEDNEKVDEVLTRRSQLVSELSGLHHDSIQDHRSSTIATMLPTTNKTAHN
jgi:hypothetical protein